MIADFFLHLKNDKNLSISTIKGYRAALNSTFLHTSHADIIDNPVIIQMIKALENQPKPQKEYTEWDLTFVLMALARPPFEPLKKASIMDLTLKTFFLLLLASGRRRFELLAIDIDRTEIKQNGHDLFLYPNRAFVPKTSSALESTGKTFSPIHLPSLSYGLDKNDPDTYWCPVRAYHCYIKRTKDFRRNRRQLFIPTQKERLTNLKINSLTGWTKKLITKIYQETDPELKHSYNITPHKIRSLAASLAESNGISMEEILKIGTWTNHTTFTSFYLKDVTVMRKNLMALNHLVIGQHRFN